MIIVGELINASRKSIETAIEKMDTETVTKLAIDQVENGADYIDVNAGVFVGKEPEYLKWLTSTVQAAVDAPCCIDSPDPKAIESALTVHNGTPMINSISLEKERYEALLPIVAGTDFKVVALCMSDKGMPQTTDERMGIAEELVNNLVKNNVPVENILLCNALGTHRPNTETELAGMLGTDLVATYQAAGAAATCFLMD